MFMVHRPLEVWFFWNLDEIAIKIEWSYAPYDEKMAKYEDLKLSVYIV